jgi:hypothetical protein
LFLEVALNAQQYQALIEACDSVLLAPDSTIERIAISWLHVLNEHPTNLASYHDLFNGHDGDRLGRLKSLALTLLQLAKIRLQGQPWISSAPLPARADVLIVSHLLNASQFDSSDDFYFGGLPEEIEAQGSSCVVVMRNHTGTEFGDIQGRWPSSMAPRLMFRGAIGWRDEARIRRRLAKEAGCLLRFSGGIVTEVERRVRSRAAREAFSFAAIVNMRFYLQMKTLVANLRPRTILVTYEGHAWERLAFAAARAVFHEVQCIGYQHAILFPRQHAIKRSLGSQYDPDVILTAGEITQAMLHDDGGLAGVRLATVGTHRQEMTGEPLPMKLADMKEQFCLVIPDGTISECLTIFDFMLKAAKLAPRQRFLIRMHPVLPYESVVAHDRRLAMLPSNVEISSRPISEDMARSRWALYRGSGAAIRAVVSGLRPFYIRKSGELCIDPIERLNDWRCVVETPEEFLSRVEIDKASDPVQLDAELSKGREFCQRYHSRVDLDMFRYEVVGERR